MRLLAAEGAKVACLDRPADDAPLSQIAREIGGTPILADVSDPEAPAKIAGELKERLGGVDIVVHNAGITRDKTLAKMKPELWDQTIDVNLAAVARITDALTRTRAGPARRRAHHLPVVGGGHRRQHGADQLRGVEGRHHRLRARAGAEAGRARHHRQRHRARASSRRG